MSADSSVKLTGDYRKHIPNLDVPRFQMMKAQDAHQYAHDFKTVHNPPWLHALYMHWRKLLVQPLVGVTSDGRVRKDVFKIQDEGLQAQKMVDAAHSLLSLLDEKQKELVSYHIDAPEWRTWSNPEFLLADKGLRLDELSTSVRDAVMALVEASLSPEGYQKAVGAMRMNGFLGELVNGTKVMNEFSYNFVLFGAPTSDRPWGWQFYGHHLCLNVLIYKDQIVVGPWFTGAEPNEIDEGPYKGTKILYREEALGLKLMQSLKPELQAKAQVFKEMNDPAFPPGRWNRDDQRHLCGAYRDNRLVPYEGVTMADLMEDGKQLISAILEEYLLFLPEKSRALQLRNSLSYPEETYFCWIGGFEDTDAFYYRIQNPAIIVEFDHHSGVFLNNTEPAKFHVHTLLRLPNGGDYGHALKQIIPPLEDHFEWHPESEDKGNNASRTD